MCMKEMTFRDLVQKRYSCRDFLDTEIDKNILEEIADAARLQPSAVNSQQYKIHICTKNAARRVSKARGMYNGFIDNVPAFIVITEDRRNIALKAINLAQYNDWVPIDIVIAVSAICYRALELGVSSCILGLYKEKEIQEIIGDKNKVAIVIALGYQKEEKDRPKKRRSFDEICVYHEE